jgi:hypothetical protein
VFLWQGGGVWGAVYFCIGWWLSGVGGFNTQSKARRESHIPQLGVGGRWGQTMPNN